MTSYIVRIYREEENNPRNFVGTVEEAADGIKRVFTSLDELWAIINPAKKGGGRDEKQNKIERRI